jgi:hypothetical protein
METLEELIGRLKLHDEILPLIQGKRVELVFGFSGYVKDGKVVQDGCPCREIVVPEFGGLLVAHEPECSVVRLNSNF